MTAPPALPLTWLDRVMLSLVLGLGFLVASFPARNSDLWQHLATGRLLAAGEFSFGPDPFAYTTEGVVWVDHAWLFDLSLYLTYSTLGGAAVVLCKALGVGLLAVVLLRFRREDASPSLVALCVLLALIAMSPRLLVQPVVASLLMLALCLNRLHRGGRAAWAVPPLIALWVNLDAWFVLGPLLVVVFWLSRPPADRRIPALVVPASLLACLIRDRKSVV